jgi:hypothetical protein
MVGEDLYNGKDRLTGLHDSFYFSDEYERRKAELKRSGESNLLLLLHLREDTPEERVKSVAEYWKDAFIRVCRYEKKGYAFMALDKDVSDADSKEQEILDALVARFPGIIARISSTVINGDSGSLDELAEQLSA